MRNFAWIWFAGFFAWLIDGLLSLRFHSMQHAVLAFMLALLFLFAALFYRQQKR